MGGKEALVALGGYALGCVCTGYYLVRWRTGEDIRNFGSGNVGAKNVGRRLGPPWFAAALAGDAAKGAAAVLAARWAGAPPPGEMAALLAVLAGHLWPVHLGFRGGKGVATFLGALAAFDYRILLVLLLVSGAAMLVARRFSAGGLAAIAVSPAVGGALRREWAATAALAAAAAMVLFAHRENLRAFRRSLAGDGPGT